ncbi:hypothetical protein [Nocardioides aquiterrae]|uniref:PH domain-containing protein n=1 Tax=Nocardioides aquiterrae TaxID=203799 RepID=A0ABN1UB65_9ACTN
MSDHHADPAVEKFHATNGRASGYIGLACTAVILGLAIAGWSTGRPLGVAILAVLGALLIWVVMLRPGLWATGRELVLRGMYHTDTIPLAAIDRVAVGQVTAVSVGDKRYLSPVVGYSARQTVRLRAASRKAGTAAPSAIDTYQVFVEERITHLARDARDRNTDPAATVRRTYAWPELAGTAVLVAAFLVWLLAF